MHNSIATKPHSKHKGDPYRAYEQPPVEVRLAHQEALVDCACCGRAIGIFAC